MNTKDNNHENLTLNQERTYIAHELHDSLAQTLASFRYTIRNLDHAIQGGDECEIYEIMEVLENNVEVANRELRELITRFRAPLDELSLIPAVENEIKKFKSDTGIDTVFQNELVDSTYSSLVASQVIRIVQEALTNVRKHANANLVRVFMHLEKSRIHILVEDDGVGFQFNGNAASSDHFGLRVMQERAQRIRGKLSVQSMQPNGTRVHLVFPGETKMVN